MKTPPKDCVCMKPPFDFKDFDIRNIGTDGTSGRYGEVNIHKCKKCGNHWLHYFVEYEAFAKSGRWFKGVISENEIESITPKNSITFLESLEWYFYGGSYFDSTGKIGKGEIQVD